ncbi:hypothetical protein [Halorussus lipolyticus]|uniref:hypothetical protein n=1 Tax=Halorussus lipolyticus TaxID=3034024 RepID=UPI0023E8FBA6|nr:hypothetical protein [Halorussus sp. DT80]
MTLLGARQFEDLPEALVGAFESESKSVVDLDSVGKLVLAGSKVTEGGGAVVWADWTDDELVAVLKSSGKTEITTESYEERTLYTTGKISAAVLGDDQFALGTPEVVRDIVDVWYGDAEPVGGTTLDSFERTPQEACVRFSFEKLRLACDGLAAQSEVYDSVTQIYGSVPPEGDEVRLRLRVESSAATTEVATAVSDALGLGNRDGSEVNTILPPKARDDVTVGHEHDFVSVEYTQNADEDVTSAGGIIETIVCMTGHSR